MTERKGKREAEARDGGVARPDWLVAGLALAGLVVAGYLTWLKLRGVRAALCVAGSGCDIVQGSRYAIFLGVPTALWGAVLYAAVGALALSGLRRQRWMAAFLLAAAGVGFSGYMTWLSLFDLGAACVYCLASAGIGVSLLAALVWRRPPARGRRSPLRPAALAALAGSAAVGAVVVGAFVFAWDQAAPSGYQSALARHLEESGAVMYGAFW